MFSLFNNLRNSHKLSLSTRRSRRQASARGSLRVEALEERRVLSATVHTQALAASLNQPVSAAHHSAQTVGHHASQRDHGNDGTDTIGLYRAQIPVIIPRQPVAFEVQAPSVLSHASRSNTVAIDSCFTNSSGLLDATSAATGNGSVTPLPAGFFAPGSNVFDGPVVLRGQPSNPSDTIVQRMDSLVGPLDGAQKSVPIEIVSLSLVSIQPVAIQLSVPLVLRINTEELNLQTDAPIIGEALFQRLAPKAPQPPPVSGSNFEICFDPTSGFRGGVTVATGDVNADGFADIIVGVETGAGVNVNGVNNPVPTGNNVVCANPAGTGNAADALVNGNVQVLASLSSGGLRRIEELLQNIKVLQDAKDDLGFFSDPLGGKRQSLQDQIDKKLAEADAILGR